MVTSTVSAGTAFVSTHISAGTSYVVKGSGTLDVVNGGVVSGPITVSGFPATVNVSSGGIVSGPLTISDTRVQVYSGGTTEQTTIVDFGSLFVSGGVAISTTVNTFSELQVFFGGLASATTVSGGQLNVKDGGTANLTTATANADLSVHGLVISTTILSGAKIDLLNFAGVGNASATIVSGGGTLADHGLAVGTIVSNGGTEIVDLLGIDISATVLSGGTLIVSGGINERASATTISSGGLVIIDGGAILSGAVNNGTIVFQNGGILSGTLTGSGTLVVAAGDTFELASGTVTKVAFSGIGNLLEIDDIAGFISGGPVVSGFTIDNVIELVGVSGGSAATLSSGNVLLISAGGSVYHLQLDPGANYSGTTFSVFPANGGSSTFVTLDGQQPAVSGGPVTVSTGQVASNMLVLSGGSDVVSSGGTVSGTIVVPAGVEKVAGIASGTTVLGYIITGPVLGGGGAQIVSSGGTAVATTVSSGGSQVVSSGGLTSGATLISGGNQIISAGGSAVSTTLSGIVLTSNEFTINAVQSIGSGGTATTTTVGSGGFQYVFGLANVTVVNSGGNQNIGSGGTASNTTINDGGAQAVNGGTANTATISTGGVQTVAGGVAISATISGGAQTVGAGGSAVSTTIDSGGTQTVGNGFSSATASATTISTGGTQIVNFGGKAVSTTIASGGLEQVFDGGTMSGLVISGGVLELGGTSFGSGAITFAAPGGIAHFTPGSTALSNVISGLDAGDSLYFDATPVNFSPLAFGVTDTATLSGSTQLHAVLNGTTYNFTLADLSPGVSFDVVPIAVGFLGNPTFPFATAINAVSATSVTTTLSNTTVTLGQAERVLGTTLNISVGTGGEQTVKNGGRTSNTTIDSGRLAARVFRRHGDRRDRQRHSIHLCRWQRLQHLSRRGRHAGCQRHCRQHDGHRNPGRRRRRQGERDHDRERRLAECLFRRHRHAHH
jgi:autotransporter passenger strand-loop-strand repeat protein